MPRVRGRNWSFTIWIHDEQGSRISKERYLVQRDEFAPITEKIKEADYMVYQYEISTEKPSLHIQGYIRFANARTLGGVKKLLEKWSEEKGPHLDISRGNALENKEYCTKLESRMDGPFEFGECPTGDDKADLVRAWEMFCEGGGVTAKLMAEYPTYTTMYSEKWKKIKWDIDHVDWKPQKEYKKKEVIVLWGDTEAGKTRYAFERGAFLVTLSSDYPFDDYRGQKVVCFDEFRGQLSIDDFLRLTDGYPTTVRALYHGNVPFIAERIYVTSNLHPKDWYKNLDARTWKALQRRITTIEFMAPEIQQVVEPAQATTNTTINNLPANETLGDDIIFM